jgi:hypothetical protein
MQHYDFSGKEWDFPWLDLPRLGQHCHIIGSDSIMMGVSAATAQFLLENSLLFNGTSKYLNRTPGTAGNRKTWTFSAWVKRGNEGISVFFGTTESSGNYTHITFISTDKVGLALRDGGAWTSIPATDAVVRDPAAWYHIVVAVDTTQATDSDRVKIYLNGVEQSLTSVAGSSWPSQNYDTDINTTNEHWVGGSTSTPDGPYYHSGLMALPILVDGAALDATSFGELDDNGYWNPIEFTGADVTSYDLQVDITGETIISPFSSLSPTSAVNDGTTSKVAASCASNSSSSKFSIGVDWGVGNERSIQAFKLYGSSDQGIFNGANPTETFELRGHATAPTDEGQGTLLFTGEFTDSNGIVIEGIVNQAVSLDTTFRYHTVEMPNTGANRTHYVAQIEYFETTTTANSFGTNGFQLDYADTADFGNDTSGNGNDYTPNNFTATDQLSDTPTDSADDEIGNFATLNPIYKRSGVTLSEGNLRAAFSGGDVQAVLSTMPLPDNDLIYIEVLWNTYAGDAGIGLLDGNLATGNWYTDTNSRPSGLNNTDGFAINDSANHYVDGNGLVSLSAPSTGQYQQLAVNTTNGKVWYGINNTWLNSGDPVAGTGEVGTFDAANLAAGLFFYIGGRLGANATVNFGQKAFNYTPPTGFKAIATQNFPAPTIADGSDYFNTVLYTGNGTSKSITGVGFQPDFVWIKKRDSTSSHILVNVIAGATERLSSDNTNPEATAGPDSFDSDGFTVGSGGAINASGEGHVAWCWKAGGAASSDTSGNITVSRSTNTDALFSIVSGTGNSGSGANFGHGFGVPVDFGIFKNRDSAQTWYVYHKDLVAAEKVLHLDTTAAASVQSSIFGTSSSSQFYLDGGGVNAGTDDWIAYLWAGVEGFSKFGSYTGNGSSDGPFIYLGFKPAFLMIKRFDSTGGWHIYDKERLGYNPNNNILYADTNGAEISLAQDDLLSNGFKMRNTGAARNASGGTYIYVAFAENPFQGDDGYTQARAR